ncbi:uncharacterized protein LOC128218451 [Mya arenaria]|uniref:uncharacterized protein LOC128218451 n=1 Tax=Mya arenaria TaxID=6604 RepID=UPI0022E40DDA|nr:uncharacterized protein LOC128218451 [Mya arenaria]
MILLLLCYSCLLVISGTQDVTCGADCSCHGYTMACLGENLPTYLPWNITEIFLQDVDFKEVAKHFQSQPQEWSAITRLTLQSTFSKEIVSGMFTVFKVLKYLKVEGDVFSNISISAFVGLDTVETLDLSANGNLLYDSVAKALCFVNNGIHVLSNLKMLNISWIGRKYFEPVNMDFNFFVSLSSGRRLKQLDISHINLAVLDIRNFYPLCDNGLETLVLEFAVFSSVGYYYIPDLSYSITL